MDNVINWINNEIMRNQVYHDHKENMAWVATAFYITGAITLPIFLKKAINDPSANIIFTIIFTFVTVAIFIFIHWQFKNRWTASGWVKGLILTNKDLCSKAPPELDLTVKDWTVKGDDVYPTFIMDNVPPEQSHIKDRCQSEFISYFIMVVAFIASVILIWSLK